MISDKAFPRQYGRTRNKCRQAHLLSCIHMKLDKFRVPYTSGIGHISGKLMQLDKSSTHILLSPQRTVM